MNRRTLQEILQEYERLRDASAAELQQRTAEVYQRIPRIAEIDRQMSQVGIDIVRWVLRNPQDQEKALQEIRATQESLQRERVRILSQHGLTPDFLELKHRCAHCRDTGYLPDGHPCRCLRQRLIDRAYADANLGQYLKDQNFNAFRLELFSEAPFPGKHRTPRENMKRNRDIGLKFVEQFEGRSTPNLIFYGDTGLGKTFLCSCIAQALLDKGYTVLYQTAFRVAEAMERYKFGNKENADVEEPYRQIYECDLLIVDDLGTELTNAFTNVEFFNILNSRLMANRKMIFSTNLSTPELIRTYGERIASRILSHFELMEFYGSDLRYR